MSAGVLGWEEGNLRLLKMSHGHRIVEIHGTFSCDRRLTWQSRICQMSYMVHNEQIQILERVPLWSRLHSSICATYIGARGGMPRYSILKRHMSTVQEVTLIDPTVNRIYGTFARQKTEHADFLIFRLL